MAVLTPFGRDFGPPDAPKEPQSLHFDIILGTFSHLFGSYRLRRLFPRPLLAVLKPFGRDFGPQDAPKEPQSLHFDVILDICSHLFGSSRPNVTQASSRSSKWPPNGTETGIGRAFCYLSFLP